VSGDPEQAKQREISTAKDNDWGYFMCRTIEKLIKFVYGAHFLAMTVSEILFFARKFSQLGPNEHCFLPTDPKGLVHWAKLQ
tara:strand:+ start:256 stop:501 length:246 start_codon:yes stop_codon:yes gene_type:complete